MARYTSFGTRKALGKRYAIDPALLLEMERLRQEYALAPGREARALQERGLAQQESQFQRGQALTREQLEAQERGGMIETGANLASTAALIRAIQIQGTKEPFFDGLLGGGKTTVSGMPLQTPGTFTVSGMPLQTPGAATVSGMPLQTPGVPTQPPTMSPYSTYPAGTDIPLTTGSEVSAPTTGPTTGISGAIGSGVTSATGSEMAGGIAGGAAYAAPYYAAAKMGGSLLTSLRDPAEQSTLEKVFVPGESLQSPLSVERYWLKEAGVDPSTANTIADIISPGGVIEDVIDWASEKAGEVVGTVICTEMHRQGYINDKTLAADAAFGRKQDLTVIAGYHAWAIPVARWMRKSRIVTQIVRPIALAWAENMAYVEGVRDKPNIIGAIIHKIGVPICRLIGTLKRGVAWQI